jgi:hypothetical protein
MAYFNDYLNLQNINGVVPPIFDKAVGINGNFSTQANTTIKFSDDVWFNGDFITPNGTRDDGIKLNSDNPNNKIYYTNKIPMDKTVMGCKSCKPENGGTMCVHNCVHPVEQSTRITGFSNMDYTYFGPSSGSPTDPKSNIDNIPQKMKMTNPTLEERRDDELSLDNIPLDNRYSVSEVKSNCGGFSVKCIEEKWEEAKTAGTLYNNEHLVIKVSGSDPMRNYFGDNTPGTLNKKIILILDDGAVLGGKYFKTGPESSSLIYVGKNAQLDQFSINGAFHGLIYIDADNKTPSAGAKNTINSGENDTLYGAFHSFSDDSFIWNKGEGTKPSVIVHDPKVLENFATMVKCKPNKPCEPSKQVVDWTEEAKTDPSKQRVRLRAAGYYFH